MSEYTLIDKVAFENDKTSSFGWPPHHRPLQQYIEYGFVVLDKPAGPTSHDVVATVKKILGISKAGHSGTLDPQVTGVLLIAFSKSTKALSLYATSDKEYVCNFHTQADVFSPRTEEVIKEFTAEIYQVPPLESNVAKRLRKRTIHDIEILDRRPAEMLLRIKCQSGTYIRTLCLDMGRALGHSSFMKELRRTVSSKFTEADAVTLHQLYDAFWKAKELGQEADLRSIVQPVENMTKQLPALIVKDTSVDNICHGMIVTMNDIHGYQEFSKGQQVQMVTAKSELIGIGKAMTSTPLSSPQLCQPVKILMTRGTYPRGTHSKK